MPERRRAANAGSPPTAPLVKRSIAQFLPNAPGRGRTVDPTSCAASRQSGVFASFGPRARRRGDRLRCCLLRLNWRRTRRKKNIDQVFAYGQCVKAGQRARVGKWVCQVSKTAGMEVVHRDLRLAQLATLRLEARWRRPRHADQRTPDPTWLPAVGSGQSAAKHSRQKCIANCLADSGRCGFERPRGSCGCGRHYRRRDRRSIKASRGLVAAQLHSWQEPARPVTTD